MCVSSEKLSIFRNTKQRIIMCVSSEKLSTFRNTKKRIISTQKCAFSYFEIWINFQMKQVLVCLEDERCPCSRTKLCHFSAFHHIFHSSISNYLINQVINTGLKRIESVPSHKKWKRVLHNSAEIWPSELENHSLITHH